MANGFKGFDYTYGVGMEFKATSAKQVKDELKMNLDTLSKMVKSYSKVLKIDPNADLSKLYAEMQKIQGLVNGINKSDNSFANFVDKGVLSRISNLESGLATVSATSKEVETSLAGLTSSVATMTEALKAAGAIKFPATFDNLFGDVKDQSAQIKNIKDQIKVFDSLAKNLRGSLTSLKASYDGKLDKNTSIDQVKAWLDEFNKLKDSISKGAKIDANKLYDTLIKLSDLSQKINMSRNTFSDADLSGLSTQFNQFDNYSSTLTKRLDNLVAQIAKKREELSAELGKFEAEQAKFTAKNQVQSSSGKSLGISDYTAQVKVAPKTNDVEWINKINDTIKNIEPQLNPVALTPTFSKGKNIDREIDGSLAQVNHAVKVDLQVTDNIEKFNEKIQNIDKSIKNAKAQLEKEGNFKIRFEYEEGGKFKDAAYGIINKFKHIETKFYIANGKKFINDIKGLKDSVDKKLKEAHVNISIGNQDALLAEVDTLRTRIDEKIGNIGVNLFVKNSPDFMSQVNGVASSINIDSGANNAVNGMEKLSEAAQKANETLIKANQAELNKVEAELNIYLQKQIAYAQSRQAAAEKILQTEKEIAATKKNEENQSQSAAETKNNQQLAMSAEEAAKKVRSLTTTLTHQKKALEDLEAKGTKSSSFVKFGEWDKETQSFKKNSKHIQDLINKYNKLRDARIKSGGAGKTVSGEEASIRSKLSSILTQQKKHISEIIAKNQEELASAKQIVAAYKEAGNNKSKVAKTKMDIDTTASTKKIEELTTKLNKAKEALTLLKSKKFDALSLTGLGDPKNTLAGGTQSFKDLIKEYNMLIAKRNQLEKSGMDISHPEYVAYAKQYQVVEQKLNAIYKDQLQYTQNKISDYEKQIAQAQQLLQIEKQQTEEKTKQSNTTTNKKASDTTGSTSATVKLDGATLNSLAKDATLKAIDGKLNNIMASLGKGINITGSNISIAANNVDINGAVTNTNSQQAPTSTEQSQATSSQVNVNQRIASTAENATKEQKELNHELKETKQLADEALSSTTAVVSEKTRTIKKLTDVYRSPDRVSERTEISGWVSHGENEPATFEHVSTVYKTNMEAFDNLYQKFVKALAKQKQIEQQIANSNGPTSKLQAELDVQKEITSSLESQLKCHEELYTQEAQRAAIAEATKKALQEMAKSTGAQSDKEINKQNVELAKIVNNAQKRLNNMQYSMNNFKIPMAAPAMDRLKEYEQLLTTLKRKQQEIAANPNLLNDKSYSKGFITLLQQMQKVDGEFSTLQKSSENFLRKIRSIEDIKPLDRTFNANNLEQMHDAMQDFANQAGVGAAKLIEFNDVERTATFEIKNGKGQVQQLTVAYDAATNSLGRFASQTRSSLSETQKFANSLKHSFQNVARYVMSFGSVYRLFAIIRQGVTYVKEIDSALTELKKVTDETSASYDQFLQDMSKTASTVGSTVKDLTTMAAEWARLGSIIKSAPLYSNIY